MTTTDTPAPDLDAMDREAAEFQEPWVRGAVDRPGVREWCWVRAAEIGHGWRLATADDIESVDAVRYARPTRDHGDALRLLEFTLNNSTTVASSWGYKSVYIDNADGWRVAHFGDVGIGDTLTLAITRACLAALRAVVGQQGEGTGQ